MCINIGQWSTIGLYKYRIYQKKKEEFTNSYVDKIITTSYSKSEVRNILDTFDKQSYNSIVHYEGTRPIIIVETNKGLKPWMVGLAKWDLNKCVIILRPNLGVRFREVLLHEYMHCFGYEHKDNKKDLMYYSVYYAPSEKSIENYARDLGYRYGRKRKYEPK